MYVEIYKSIAMDMSITFVLKIQKQIIKSCILVDAHKPRVAPHPLGFNLGKRDFNN